MTDHRSHTGLIDEGLFITRRSPTPHPPETRVVLVHGSLDRAASFRRVARRLEHLDVTTYDRRGYQHSRHLAPSDQLERHVDDLLAIIDGTPALVLGHSFGGLIALGAALRKDSPVVGVIAHEPPMPWLPLWQRRRRTEPEPERALRSPEDEAERFFRRMVGDEAWERLSAEAKADRRADGPALAADLRCFRSGTALVDLVALRVPTVFSRGTISAPHHRDTVGWCHEQVLDSELVEIPGAAHGAHLTHPTAVAELVTDLCARLGSTPPVLHDPA